MSMIDASIKIRKIHHTRPEKAGTERFHFSSAYVLADYGETKPAEVEDSEGPPFGEPALFRKVFSVYGKNKRAEAGDH